MFGSRILGLGGLYHSEGTYEREAADRLNTLILDNEFRFEQERFTQERQQTKETINITPETQLIEEKTCQKKNS